MTSVPMTFLHSIWSRIALRRADILGREQGQTVVRVVIVAILLSYLAAAHYPLELERGLPGWLIYLVLFLAFSLAVATAALRDRHSPAYRRIIANIGDIATITYLMSNTGEAGAALFVLYLWVTLGNGFRFGVTAMCVSTGLSVAGFAVVMMTVDLWRQHVMLSAGVMVALLVIPANAARLIRQLHRAREHAEEASAAKGQFLAHMSHKLRTPLNGILGTTELLRNNRWLNAADRELLGVIQESVSVSLRQIEVGKLVLEQTEFDPKGAT